MIGRHFRTGLPDFFALYGKGFFSDFLHFGTDFRITQNRRRGRRGAARENSALIWGAGKC